MSIEFPCRGGIPAVLINSSEESKIHHLSISGPTSIGLQITGSDKVASTATIENLELSTYRHVLYDDMNKTLIPEQYWHLVQMNPKDLSSK